MNTHENPKVDPELSNREPPISVHRFDWRGALGRTCLFILCGMFALVVGFGCLGACGMTIATSTLQAILWGLFSLCGFISAFALANETIRMYTKTPSVISVYRSGLLLQKRGKETRLSWAEINRVERNVIVRMRNGCEHRTDTTTLFLASGQKVRIWAEILSDYLTFADSVKYFHECANFAVASGTDKRPKKRTTPMRCWHCGEHFDLTTTDQPGYVSCPRCKAGLGVVAS